MLISLQDLIQKYQLQFTGILHVGAHNCEELSLYESILDRSQIVWIEAIPEKVVANQQKYANLLIEQAIVSDVEELVEFKISNNGQSSSILDFGLHSQYYPSIIYVGSFQATTQRLEHIVQKYTILFNFVNLDIQGAELKALKGLGTYLEKVDYIYTEVNNAYVYKECALIGELDIFLQSYGFVRVETKWTDCHWGDAFYVKTFTR